MSSKDEQAVEEQAAAPGNKKLFIIGGAVLAVVLVAAAVFMFTGKGGGDTKHAEAKTEKKAEGGGHGGEGAAASPVYALDPFIVNIYDGQEIRYLRTKVEFETSGAEATAELETRKAQLRDAILVLLTTKTLQDIQDLQGKNQLREEILAAVNRIVPPGKVAKVYFTDFVVQ